MLPTTKDVPLFSATEKTWSATVAAIRPGITLSDKTLLAHRIGPSTPASQHWIVKLNVIPWPIVPLKRREGAFGFAIKS